MKDTWCGGLAKLKMAAGAISRFTVLGARVSCSGFYQELPRRVEFARGFLRRGLARGREIHSPLSKVKEQTNLTH